MRAVAERAGVNERTVYRHFTNERGLRDAVMHRMEEQAGIDLAALRLEDIADVARRIFAEVSDAPAPAAAGARPDPHRGQPAQRAALLRALGPADRGVERRGPHRGGGDVRRALGRGALRAAGRPTGASTRTRPSRGITWVIGLIEDAVRAGRRP